jgi:uncharacterized protein YdaU (DUF1376 family)
MVEYRTDIWMPVYPGDWLKQTMHLDALQFGALMLLAIAYWSRQGPLPDDNRQLATICRMDVATFEQIKPTLAAFFTNTNGRLRNNCWSDLIANAQEQKAKYSARGKHAANKRWHAGDDREREEDADDDG